MTIRRRISKKSLRGQIEREIIPSVQNSDGLDNDISGYLSSLLTSYSQVEKMEKIDLLSQEGAVKALEVLDEARDNLDTLLKQTHALQTLLAQKKMS